MRHRNIRKALLRGRGQKAPRSAESTRKDYRYYWEAVVLAADRTKKGKRGRNSLEYLVELARTEPRAFAALLAEIPVDAVIGEAPLGLFEAHVFESDGTTLVKTTSHEVSDPPQHTDSPFFRAVVHAAEQVGEDDRGRGGLRGYLARLARTEPRFFAKLFARAQRRAIIEEEKCKPIYFTYKFDKPLKTVEPGDDDEEES